ncbi:hypothetical protein KDAU_03530 [Dictyobacter aurantiacus]|uniref:Uncharacterized protein n=1 Tax=Dictyobacter aurantiacus TaxID=1936993 RepID=A0A401Z839_9CHLR|nr:hypothetical protein KDAU_03530 [Dictyobacter aurantiacus]
MIKIIHSFLTGTSKEQQTILYRQLQRCVVLGPFQAGERGTTSRGKEGSINDYEAFNHRHRQWAKASERGRAAYIAGPLFT